MKKFCRIFLLFVFGGCIYILVEVLWRVAMCNPPTHWTMFIVGGVSFLILGSINEGLSWEMPFLYQCVVGTLAVILVEFVSGCILNLWLGLAIWDYSEMPMNVLGQICPQFALAWFFLSGVGIVVDDWLRYYMFSEDYPHYILF